MRFKYKNAILLIISFILMTLIITCQENPSEEENSYEENPSQKVENPSEEENPYEENLSKEEENPSENDDFSNPEEYVKVRVQTI
jgi:cytoskeletal protein RodZ